MSGLCALAVCLSACMGGKGGSRGGATHSPSPTPEGNNGVNQTTTIAEHPVVNVYLENSGSMNGYVNGGQTLFQQDVYNYLCDIDISGIPSEINLHFINSQIIDQGSVIANFIHKLTPNSFHVAGGNTATTDIASVFKQVLAQTDDDTVSVFISDCIFSPGSVQSPEAYLVNQQVGIKKCVADYLAMHSELAILVYQLYSNFNGTYYDYRNRPRSYVGERPYYIWVMGHPLNIAKLRVAIPNEKFSGAGVQNEWCIYNKTVDQVAYSIVSRPVNGDFDRNSDHAISKIKKGNNGQFAFMVTANFTSLELLLGNEYLMNADNYSRLINKQDSEEWYIEIARNTNPSSPATHNIILGTDGPIPQGNLSVAVRCSSPQWAYDFTDDDDSNFTDANQRKTYGLKYMFDGIQQAFTARSNGIYAVMDFKINT